MTSDPSLRGPDDEADFAAQYGAVVRHARWKRPHSPQ